METNGRPPRRAPGKSAATQEQKLISLAYKQAEHELEQKTASSQTLVHFLKLGSSLADLEKEKLVHENKLLEARTRAIEAEKDHGVLLKKAIFAMSIYAGESGEQLEDNNDSQDV